jgi:Arylsulfotransferase (ASST)
VSLSKVVSMACLMVLLLLIAFGGAVQLVKSSHLKPISQVNFLDRIISHVETLPRDAWVLALGDFGRIYLVGRDQVAGSSDWKSKFPEPSDHGFLLFAGYDPEIKSTAVRLVRVSDGAVLLDWNIKAHGKKGLGAYFAAPKSAHPLLLEQGDIAVNLDGNLVRLRTCRADPVWVVDKLVHHSISATENGDILVASFPPSTLFGNPALSEQIQDNAILRVRSDGAIISEDSVGEILLENGFKVLLMGHFGMNMNVDPIHMNEIVEAPTNTDFWQMGDLLISTRNMSTLFLYRPSTRKIIWHQTGPWMNQHSAAFVGTHEIMVFNNNVATVERSSAFLDLSDVNEVMVYDFLTGQVSQPYQSVLSELAPRTATEGRAQILPDGTLFLEETNNGRLMKISLSKLLWSYVNSAGPNDLAQLRWSRYYSRDEITTLLPTLNLDNAPATYSGCLN